MVRNFLVRSLPIRQCGQCLRQTKMHVYVSVSVMLSNSVFVECCVERTEDCLLPEYVMSCLPYKLMNGFPFYVCMLDTWNMHPLLLVSSLMQPTGYL